MIDKLFRFPIVMVDGMQEEKKRKQNDLMNTGTDDEGDVDIIIGEAELPYYDFLGLADRWLPSTDSFNNALQGKFDACIAHFANGGDQLVPWPKAKFKKEYIKFVSSLPPMLHTIQVSKEDIKKILLDKETDIDVTED